MKRVHRIAKRRARSPQAQEQPRALNGAALDLGREGYLTVRQTMEYLQLRTKAAVYKFLERNPRVRRRRVGVQLRIWRPDLAPPSIGLQSNKQVAHSGGQ